MAAEKLRDLTQPIDVPLLDATVAAFYGTGSKQERSAADSILRDLQNNPDMWLQVMHILQNTQNLNTKFFALQVLEGVIKYRWNALPAEQRDGMKNFISDIIVQLSSNEASFRMERLYVNKLNIILVQILLFHTHYIIHTPLNSTCNLSLHYQGIYLQIHHRLLNLTMFAAVGAMSKTKDASFNVHLEEENKNKGTNKVGDENYDDVEQIELDEDEEEEHKLELDLGPQFSLKEQLEKDKDDESLRKWKEQLLGNVDVSAVGEKIEPEVKIVSLTIICQGRPDLILPIPFTTDSKKTMFILKEASQYRLKFSFIVSNNIVSGLKYTNVVWKTGIRVDSTKKMLGTYSPQQEPYTYELEEEITPSGLFARGTYSARTKFVDDDRKCYLDATYRFEIQKNWPTPH